MIRGVLFDYGGVVAAGGPGSGLVKRIGAVLDMDPETALTVILPFWRQLTRGKLTEQGFWEAIAEKTDSPITSEQQHAWDDWWSIHPFPEMIQLINSLKDHGYQVGVLSNIIPNAKAAIEAAGSYQLFDFAVLSCEVGTAKPEPEIYELALAKFNNLRPEEIAFIDDQQRFLDPANAMGVTTILATDSAQVISELKKLNLPL